MSAQLDSMPRYRRMAAADLDAVIAIEDTIYPHPWTHGNFRDSLAAGYHCWIVECGGEMAGYTVVMIAAGEAHLLNLSVAAPWQRRGIGREALAFYAAAGFAEIAKRRSYYPAGDSREDAIVLELELQKRDP
jgi:ribosomal-protein-alanine N-acetyltransferase